MTKQDIKYIQGIASRLPVVYEQTTSGYYQDFNESGEEQIFPNLVNHEINHERRMKKAFKALGMEGIKKYLEYINKLQIQRNGKLQHNQDTERKDEAVDYVPQGA
jgi:hypothetical protein